MKKIATINNLKDETTKKILRSTGKIIKVLKINEKTNALILAPFDRTHVNGFLVAQAFYQHILNLKGKANILTFTSRPFEKPMDEVVYNAMSDKKYNLIIQTGLDGVGHDFVGRHNPYKIKDTTFTNILFYRKALKEINAFWYYVKDLDTWLDSVNTNYKQIGNDSLILEKLMLQTEIVKFYSNNNKYLLEFKLNNHQPVSDFNFKQHLKGEGSNMPFGEVLTTPDMASAEGEILIDGSLYSEPDEKTVTMKDPIHIKFHKGNVISIKGGKEAEYLKSMLNTVLERTKEIRKKNKSISEIYEKNIFRIGEFAIGVNKKVDFCDDVLFDEKKYGTAHIALGSSYHGDPCFNHCDMVVRKPKIVFVLKNGKEKIVVNNNKNYL